MNSPHHPGRMVRPSAKPQLPAFCRTRRLVGAAGGCQAGSLLWLLYLLVSLQLSTILLVLAGPLPPATSVLPAALPPELPTLEVRP